MPRKTDYTQDLADKICEKISAGESLRSICKDEAMPRMATIFRWLANNKSFSDQYARAREEQAETLADEIVQIADDGLNDTYLDENGNRRTDQDVIARSRLRVEARKWVAAKLKPKKYGDFSRIESKVDMKVTSAIDLTDDQLAAIAMQQSTE
jgi:hypothetical protein